MCIVGCLEAFLASTHRYKWNTPLPSNCDNLICLQALTKFPQGHNYTWLRITGLVSTMNDQGDNSIFDPQSVVECEALSLLFMWLVQKLTPKTFSKKEMPRYFKSSCGIARICVLPPKMHCWKVADLFSWTSSGMFVINLSCLLQFCPVPHQGVFLTKEKLKKKQNVLLSAW